MCQEYEEKMEKLREEFKQQSVEREESLLFELDELKAKFHDEKSMDASGDSGLIR